MRTIASAVFAVVSASCPALAQVGADTGNRSAQPIRTAAIPRHLEPTNQASDALGRPLARGPITRLTPTRSAISKLRLSLDGQLALAGYGRPGTRLVLIVNRVKLAAITVEADSRWHLNSLMRLPAGNYRFSLEEPRQDIFGSQVTDEIRLSIPEDRVAPINIQFKPDEALQRQAEQVGEEASRVFDKFFQDQKTPDTRVAQASQNKSDENIRTDQPILDATLGWLGTANDAYQRQIVPRLQIGGALSLPDNVTERSRSRNTEISTWSLPRVDQVTNNLQSWFGRSSRSYDNQIIPRLSGARERRIVILRPVEQEVVPTPKTVDGDDVARRANDERRQAELRRLREIENERSRLAREEQARLAAERERLDAQREREQAQARRLAAERAERARLDEEKRRTEEELAKAEASRLRAAAERKRAEEEQRVAELATQQRINDERRRVNNELLERKRQRDREIAQARAERERARKLLEEARQARRAARQRELARIRQEREQRQAEEEQQRTRLTELWQKAKRAARDAMARTRAERDPSNQLREDRPGREITIARRNVRTAPPELPTQNRYRTTRTRPQTISRQVRATPPPLPRRSGTRSRVTERTEVAVRRPTTRSEPSRSIKRQEPTPQRTARAAKTTRSVARKEKKPKRVRAVKAKRPIRKRRVASYRKRRNPCRKRSARRIKLPGKYVVRKGDSLWRISRRHYHKGHRYWRIYKANLGKIRNPDLIYPCQRFYIPNRKSRRK